GIFLCHCGKEFETTLQRVKIGKTVSCGCYRASLTSDRNCLRATHGHSRRINRTRVTPTYGSWMAMIQRCTNENMVHWDRYGGRNIMICDRWFSFENFLS